MECPLESLWISEEGLSCLHLRMTRSVTGISRAVFNPGLSQLNQDFNSEIESLLHKGQETTDIVGIGQIFAGMHMDHTASLANLQLLTRNCHNLTRNCHNLTRIFSPGAGMHMDNAASLANLQLRSEVFAMCGGSVGGAAIKVNYL